MDDWTTTPAPGEELLPPPMPEVRRADPAEAGCWVDGHWGWRGITRVIDIAIGFGFPLSEEDSEHVTEYSREGGGADVDSCEAVPEIADEAESWLNAHVAPDGYSFGWHDGEFFLWSDASWCAASGDRCECTVPHDENGEPV